MGLVSDMIVRLGWDGSAYTRGLAHAELEAQRTSQKIERGLNGFVRSQSRFLASRFTRYFGVGMAGYAVRSQMTEVQRIVDSAGKIGRTAEEFQALEYAASRTGLSVDYLNDRMDALPESARKAVEEFKKLGLAIPNGTAGQIAQANRQIGQAGGWLKTLFTIGPAGMMGYDSTLSRALLGGGLGGISEGLNIGVSGLRKLLRKAGIKLPSAPTAPGSADKQESPDGRLVVSSGPASNWSFLDSELLGAKTKKELAQEEAIRKAMEAKTALNFQTFDPLARIGGFTQAADRDAQRNLQQRQIELLDRIAKAVEKTATNEGEGVEIGF